MTKVTPEHEYWDDVPGERTPLSPGTPIGIFPDPGNPRGFEGIVVAFMAALPGYGPTVIISIPSKVAEKIGAPAIGVPISKLGWHDNEWHFHMGDDNPHDVGEINWKVE